MYKPELKVDNKELVDLPNEVWLITIGDLNIIGRQVDGSIVGTEMMAMKLAVRNQNAYGLPWIQVTKSPLTIEQIKSYHKKIEINRKN